MEFSKIRRTHDEIYREKAFPAADDRNMLENMRVENRFKLSDGSGYDPSMRQRTLDGSRIVGVRKGEPRSQFLKEHRLDAAFLAQLDREKLSQTSDDELGTTVKALGNEFQVDDQQIECAIKLAKLARKRAQPPSEVWFAANERTDEIYEVCEQLYPVFNTCCRELARAAGLDPDSAFKVGPMKDCIRIHEKGNDDYADRFQDDELAEACVADVIRARVICSVGEGVRQIQEKLLGTFSCEVEGETATLELVRAKNKFGKDIDPTHFRVRERVSRALAAAPLPLSASLDAHRTSSTTCD